MSGNMFNPPTPAIANDAEKCDSDHRENNNDSMVYTIGDADSPRIMSPEEKALVRKLDWTMLPILWLMYWLNFLDRNAITIARLDGLEKDLGLTSTEYQTCISILFVGYILGQVPSSKSHTNQRYFGEPEKEMENDELNLTRHVHNPRPAIMVYGYLDDHLGGGKHPNWHHS